MDIAELRGLLAESPEEKSYNQGMGLLNFGLGILANPNGGSFLQRVGEGGQVGLKSYQDAKNHTMSEKQRKFALEMQLQNMQADQDAQKALFGGGPSPQATGNAPQPSALSPESTPNMQPQQSQPQQPEYRPITGSKSQDMAVLRLAKEPFFKAYLDRNKPDMQIVDGMAVDKNKLGNGQFLPGVSMSTDGKTIQRTVGPNGELSVSPVQGSVNAYSAFRQADEANKIMPVTMPDGSTRPMWAGEAANGRSNVGQSTLDKEALTKGTSNVVSRLDTSYSDGQLAAQGLPIIARARELIKNGVYSGVGGDWKAAASRVFGADANKLADTTELKVYTVNQMLSLIGQLKGASSDKEMAELKAAVADPSKLSDAELDRVMGVAQRKFESTMASHNDLMKRVDPTILKSLGMNYSIDMPKPAQAEKPKAAPTTFNSLPPPNQFNGKRMQGADGIYKSNGLQWVKQ